MSSTYAASHGRASAVGAAGGTTESLGGIIVVILAILTLVGVLPAVLAAIAGIVFGVAFIVEGAAVAGRQIAVSEYEAAPEVTVEMLAGLAAIVLGVLALIGIAPTILIGALVITGGAGLILSTGVIGRVANAGPVAAPNAAAAHLLAGLGAVVLGILTLTRPAYAAVLSEVGLLVLGASLMVSGSALSAMMLRLFQHNNA